MLTNKEIPYLTILILVIACFSNKYHVLSHIIIKYSIQITINNISKGAWSPATPSQEPSVAGAGEDEEITHLIPCFVSFGVDFLPVLVGPRQSEGTNMDVEVPSLEPGFIVKLVIQVKVLVGLIVGSI